VGAPVYSSWNSYGGLAPINPVTGQPLMGAMASPMMPGVIDSYGRPVSPMGHMQALERSMLGPGAAMFRQYMGLPPGQLGGVAGGSVQAPVPSNGPTEQAKAAAAAAVAAAKANAERGVAASEAAGARVTPSDAAQAAAATAAAAHAQAAADAAAAASTVSALVPGRPPMLTGGMDF
jgi:hypothetical protein